MRLLIFSAYFEPEIAASMYISTNLYEDMAIYGWNVELFVPMPTRGIKKEVRKQFKKKKLETKYDGRLRIHRVSMMREWKNPIFRTFRYLMINLAFIWKGLQKETDLIFVQSTPPTQGAMAAVLKKIKKVPFVYNLQDTFPDSLVNAGMVKEGSLVWKIGRVIENFTYKNADRIIVISEDIKKNIMAKGVSVEKIEVIYNWVEANNVVPISKGDNILYERFGLDRSKFYIVYAGNLGYAQNIEVILKTASLLADEKNIQFLIFGKGAQEVYYKKMARDLSLDNVRFLPMLPYDEVSYVYSLADASIVSCKTGFGGSAMPSKIWSIMSAATAVIASFDADTDVEYIIKKNRTGIFTHSGDTNAMKDAVMKLYKNRNLCNAMGNNGRNLIEHNFNRKIATQKYNSVLSDLKSQVNI